MKLVGIKFKSIAFRWLVNTYLLVVAVVVLVAVSVSVIYGSLCIERVKSLGDDYSYEFTALETATADNFEDMAFALVDSFAYKTKLEVQIIDVGGRVLISTTAFQNDSEEMPDYQTAMSSENGSATFRGENSGGEHIRQPHPADGSGIRPAAETLERERILPVGIAVRWNVHEPCRLQLPGKLGQ